MNTYIVTGGAGFIGSNLVEDLLQEENKVIVIDNFSNSGSKDIKSSNLKNVIKNNNLYIEKVDILDYDKLNNVFSKYKTDYVIHFAGKGGVRDSLNNPIMYQMINLIGLQNVLECVRKNNIKNIIFASSSSVYGNNKVPFREDDICDDQISVYAQTKKEGELLLKVYHKLYGINVICNRFFTVYGKRQRNDLAINMFTKKIIKNEQIILFGDGSTFRDYTYIDDIVDGVKKEIEYLKNNENVYEIFNLGSHHPIKLNDMLNEIENALGKKAIVKHENMQPGDVYGTYADISKATKFLGYCPKVSFKNGIRKYIDWLKNEESL